MKAVLIAGCRAVSLCGTAFADAAGDALSSKAENCIILSAPKVAVYSQSLTDAVNFLVNDLCSVEIEHANAYAQSLRSLEELKATTATSQLVGITIDPVTGELNTPPGFSMPLNMGSVMLNALRNNGGQHPQYRSIAAKAVLATKAK